MSAASIPIWASYNDNILNGAAITGTTPSSGYSLSTLGTGDPAQRILWGTSTVTITFTLGSSKSGGILVVPMHNVTPGSTTILVLTNGAGLSHSCTIPSTRADGFPPTLVVDFSADSNRTSSTWNLVITTNGVNVKFGGAVAIYPKQTMSTIALSGGVNWQSTERETRNEVETTNEYGTLYIQDMGTVSRQMEFTMVGSVATIAYALDWYRYSAGRVYAGFFWPDPTVNNKAYYGRWQKTYEEQAVTGTKRSVKFTMDEYNKGLVL